MKFGYAFLVLGALTFVSTAGFAQAEEAHTTPASSSNPERASEGHASGVMVQARLQSSGGLLSLAGGGGFLFGYQGPSYALGLGLGLTRIGASQGDTSASLTLFQVAPTAVIDVWHSADGRARANLIGSVGYGRASVSATTSSQSCVPGVQGNQICTTSNQDQSVGATLIPVMLGFGGDYFLNRNFALGAEFGLQATFVTGVDTTPATQGGVDAAANAQLAYGVLRATFVLGD